MDAAHADYVRFIRGDAVRYPFIQNPGYMSLIIPIAIPRMAALPVLLLVVMWCTVCGNAQTPSWTKAWSIGAEGQESPVGCETDAAGNIYMAAYSYEFSSPIPPSQFIASWDRAGNMRWIRTFVTGTQSSPGVMDVDAAGNVYLAATFVGPFVVVEDGANFREIQTAPGSNVIVLKYSASGELLWTRLAAGTGLFAVSGIAATETGLWFASTFNGRVGLGDTVIESSGSNDILLSALNTDGSVRSAWRAGGPLADSCHSIAAAPNGDVVLLGQFQGTAEFGGKSVTATGADNIVLARYRSDGRAEWARAEGGPAYSPSAGFVPSSLRLAVDRAGDIAVAVSFFGRLGIADRSFQATSEADAVVARFGGNGDPHWATVFEGQNLQLINGITTDADGNAYVGGFSQDLSEGTVFVAKLSTTGERRWMVSDRYGDGPSSAEGGPLCLDGAGTLYMAGSFGGRTCFGPDTIRSIGSTPTSIVGSDVFIARLSLTSSVERPAIQEGISTRVSVSGSNLIVAVPESTNGEAALYTLLGERVAGPVGLDAGAGGVARINVEALPRGTYLLVCSTRGGTTSYPVLLGR